MGIKDLFKKESEEKGEDFVEVDAPYEENNVNVRIETLKDFVDTERIQQLVREGNVVFLKIRELRNRDMSELKRAVEKLKKTCTAMNGDIVGVDEDILIVTPPTVRISRG